MTDATSGACAARAPGLAQTDSALHARIRGEYFEMPGMHLTLP